MKHKKYKPTLNALMGSSAIIALAFIAACTGSPTHQAEQSESQWREPAAVKDAGDKLHYKTLVKIDDYKGTTFFSFMNEKMK